MPAPAAEDTEAADRWRLDGAAEAGTGLADAPAPAPATAPAAADGRNDARFLRGVAREGGKY